MIPLDRYPKDITLRDDTHAVLRPMIARSFRVFMPPSLPELEEPPLTAACYRLLVPCEIGEKRKPPTRMRKLPTAKASHSDPIARRRAG